MIHCHNCHNRISSTVLYCSACSGGPPKTWPPVVLDEAARLERNEAMRVHLRELHDRGPLPFIRSAVPPTGFITLTEPPKRRSWWQFWRRIKRLEAENAALRGRPADG